MSNILEKNLYSVSEAAKILGISRVAVNKKIHRNEIKADKVGTVFVIPKKSLLPYIKNTAPTLQKDELDMIVKKAVKEYGETFKLLGKE